MEKVFKTKSSYVQNINDINDNEIDEIEKYSSKRLTPLFLSSVFFFSFGLVTFSSMLGLGIASFALGGITTIGHNFLKKKKKTTVENLNKEMDHVKKVLDNGIKDTKEYNNARVNKIKELKNTKKYLKANETRYSASSKVYNIATIVGAGLSLINPVFGIVPAVSLIASGIINKNRTKNYQDLKFTERRINNLQNDLELVKCQRLEVKENNEVEESETTRRHESEEKGNHYSGSLYPHHPMGPGFGPHGGPGFGGPGFGGPGFHALADTSNEELVSNYVAGLANEDENTSAYKKVKM